MATKTKKPEVTIAEVHKLPKSDEHPNGSIRYVVEYEHPDFGIQRPTYHFNLDVSHDDAVKQITDHLKNDHLYITSYSKARVKPGGKTIKEHVGKKLAI